MRKTSIGPAASQQGLRSVAALDALPAPWPESLLPRIQADLRASGHKIVVLDDDPTGTQTVHGVPVLTRWPVDALAAEFKRDPPAFYVLTNSRSFPLRAAQSINAEIGRNLVDAARQDGCQFAVVSRSDSTLRGHYPGELAALAAALGGDFDATLLIPYFLEGRRFTVGDIHYVAEGDRLTPVGETPFAQDAAFGFRSSNLREWVEERTEGRVPAAAVVSISLDDLRGAGPDRVQQRLQDLADGAVCVVNAACTRDMEVFVAGLLAAEKAGKRFLYRTAASFVQVRIGLAPRPLLDRGDLAIAGRPEGPSTQTRGALFVVGSYVPRTTRQLARLLAQPGIVSVEVGVPSLLDLRTRQAEITRAIRLANQGLISGRNVVIHTSRTLITLPDGEASLAMGTRISDSLVRIVQAIDIRPGLVVSKGGITSSDIATQGLGIRRAMVLGQIIPGVPVWQCGAETRFPGLPIIVFPGNVGDDDALVEILNIVRPDALATHRSP